MTDGSDKSPGWTAINEAVNERCGASDPLHWMTHDGVPGVDGLFGLDAYRIPGTWLIVSLGLSELFDKVEDDPDTSGWGIELTMRVPRSEGEARPPEWALDLVARCGAYIFRTGDAFAPGHTMDPGGPITGQADTRLTAMAFAEDPQLSPIDGPNGRVAFVEVVGVTAEELAEMQHSGTFTVLNRLALSSPLLVTDPTR